MNPIVFINKFVDNFKFWTTYSTFSLITQHYTFLHIHLYSHISIFVFIFLFLIEKYAQHGTIKELNIIQKKNERILTVIIYDK